MSEEKWEAGSDLRGDLERVDIPPTVIELDSSDSQEFSETNEQQHEAAVSSRPGPGTGPGDEEVEKRSSSPERYYKESSRSKLDDEMKKDENVVVGNRRSSGRSEEKRDTDGISPPSPRAGRNSRSRKETTTRDSEWRRGRSSSSRDMWDSHRLGLGLGLGRSSDDSPPSISPTPRPRVHRNRSPSRSRSRSRSRSPYGYGYGSRRGDRRPLPPPSGQLCRDFMAGRCRRGPQCRFSHQKERDRYNNNSPFHYHPKDKERDRDRERERYPTTRRDDDRDSPPYDSRGQNEYSRDRQSSQGYRSSSNYDEPPPYSSSERCFDFSMGRCSRGAHCRYMHHEDSSGHGAWGIRDDEERERVWDERERDRGGGSMSKFDEQGNDISSVEAERRDIRRAKGKEICKFFLEGRCSRGQGCRFSHELHGDDAAERSWSNNVREDMHNGNRTYNNNNNNNTYGQLQGPQQAVQSFYSANQNPVDPSPVNPVTGSTSTSATAAVLGSGPTLNSYTSVSSNPNPYNNLPGQTMVVHQSFPSATPTLPPPPPPPAVNRPSSMVTTEQAANIDIRAYVSQMLANNPTANSTSSMPMPSISIPAQVPLPLPHESPVTPPVELIKDEEEEGLGQNQNQEPRIKSNPNAKQLSKEVKGMKVFKNALVEVVKDLLKPSWKEGQLSREAHKTIVKKVVDKVTATMEGATNTIPQTQEKIDSYLAHSKTKLSKLVQAYVDKYVKPIAN